MINKILYYNMVLTLCVIKNIKVSSTTNHIKIISRSQSSRNPNKLISSLNNKTKLKLVQTTKYIY